MAEIGLVLFFIMFFGIIWFVQYVSSSIRKMENPSPKEVIFDDQNDFFDDQNDFSDDQNDFSDDRKVRPDYQREVDEIHIVFDAATERQRRLDQLRSLYEAGMMERDEYWERKENVEADYR